MSSPRDRDPAAIESAFSDALRRQEAAQEKHRQDLLELEAVAAEGRKAARRIAMTATVISAVVLVSLVWIMASDRAFRGMFGLVLLSLALVAAYRYWKAHS